MAESVHIQLFNQTRVKDRGVRFGDYHVFVKIVKKLLCFELGYLSNPEEETTLIPDNSRKVPQQVYLMDSPAILSTLNRYNLTDKVFCIEFVL